MAQIFGWGLLLLCAYIVFRWVRGVRNRDQQRADAWAASLAGVVAEIRTTVDVAATARAGADARSAVAVNLGANGTDLDALTLAVVDRIVPVLRARLSDDDHEHDRHDQLDHEHDRARDLPTADSERHGLDAGGSAGRALPARVARVRSTRRPAREGVMQ